MRYGWWAAGLGCFISSRRIGLTAQSPARISEEFELAPELTAEVLAFAEAHRTEVDAYIADYQAELDRQFATYQPSPAAIRISSLAHERHARESQAES